MTTRFPVKHLAQGGATLDKKLLHNGSLWAPHGEILYVETEGEITNTSSVTPVTARSLSTGVLPAGEYCVGWCFSYRHSVINGNLEVRVFVSGGADIMASQDFSCKDTSVEQRWPGMGWRRVTLSGSTTIIMEFLNDGGVGTAYMYNRRLVVMRAEDVSAPVSVVASRLPRLKNLGQSGALDNQYLQWVASPAGWFPHGFTGEGRDFSRSTTTSTTFQQHFRYSTPASFPAGAYMIHMGFTWDRASDSGDAEFRVQLNDTTDIELRRIEAPSSDTAMRYTNPSFRLMSLVAGVNNFDLDFRDLNNLTATVGIQSAYISLERVGDPGV